MKYLLIVLMFVVGFSVHADPYYKSQGYGVTTGKGSFGQAIKRPAFEVLKKDAYGLGVSSDQYGRPVKTDIFGNPKSIKK